MKNNYLMTVTIASILISAFLLIGCSDDESIDISADGDNDNESSSQLDGDLGEGEQTQIDGDSSDSPEMDQATSNSVVINEIVAKITDNNDETLPDWVELFNNGATKDLGGWILKDEKDESSFVFPDGTTINAGEYLVIEKDESGEAGFDFGLGNSDSVRLYNAAEELVDSTSWDDGEAPSNVSWGRIQNGVGEFKSLNTITKGAENIDNENGSVVTATGFCEDGGANTNQPLNWSKTSHCSGAEPDYDLLFNDSVAHRIDIIIDPGTYQQTMEDLANILGNSKPQTIDNAIDEEPSNAPPGGDKPTDPNEMDTDPMWAPVTVKFNDAEWHYVGMRYKGNSSLKSAYQMGIKKLSFRLNFDKYEDDFPDYTNQRFFGFKKMTFSNGYKDDSLMRDKLAADIFRAGGVPAARGAFARIYVDFGQGPTYFGLYTMIEDPSDRMLEQQFNDGSGNLYKPEGQGATWEQFDEASFEKKTNEDNSDWSDIQAAFSALHADQNSQANWRQGLEAVFDVKAFLKCIAYNQAMVNWDSYGVMNHNYYVYSDPSNEGKLTWFPWDLNEALMAGRQGSSESVLLDEISDKWPMIRYLLDDDEYLKIYKEELKSALETGFKMDWVFAKIDAYHNLIAPYVTGTESETSPYTFLDRSSDFTNSVNSGNTALKPHITSRHQAVKDALGL